jgi:hypothetical protein
LEEAIASFLEYYYEDYTATVQDIETAAALVQLAIETELPKTYANPLLTFDAFYFPQAEILGANPLSALILLGDGILDFTDSRGLGEAAPDYIRAHEFGLALQFIMDLEHLSGDIEAYYKIEDANSPADYRRNALEADAMAAYALAHEQGRNFELQLLLDAAKAGNAFGDCDVNEDNHHGTPEQRDVPCCGAPMKRFGHVG